MTDIIRTAAITSAMILTAVSPIAANAKVMEAPITAATPITTTNVTTSHLYNTSDGSVGRITIGGYTAELYNSSAQSVVDAYDSAAYIPWGNLVMIADHAGQGFDAIKYNGSGTIADDATITYITKVSSYQGTNTGHGINLADGRYAETVGDGQYMLYTCNDSTGVSVTVTYWAITGEAAVPAPVYEAPAQVYEAPAQSYSESSYEAAPAEDQSVVDTTVTEQTQQAQAEAQVATLTPAETIKSASDTNTTVPEFVEETKETNNASATSFGNTFFNLLTANRQDASDSDNALDSAMDHQPYYADNRRWLALAADRDESFILA